MKKVSNQNIEFILAHSHNPEELAELISRLDISVIDANNVLATIGEVDIPLPVKLGGCPSDRVLYKTLVAVDHLIGSYNLSIEEFFPDGVDLSDAENIRVYKDAVRLSSQLAMLMSGEEIGALPY